MSLCDGRALFANDKEVARRRSGAASRGNDAVIHKKCRQACRRINQWFLNYQVAGYRRKPMKKLYLLLLLFCLILTTACSKPRTTEKSIRFHGKTEAVLYTVTAPVDGEVRGLILETGDRIRKGQPLFGLGTQDENPEVGKAAAELAKAQARLNNASQGNSEASRASAAAAMQNARSEVQNAEQNYNKMQRLYNVGGISRNRMQQAQRNLERLSVDSI